MVNHRNDHQILVINQVSFLSDKIRMTPLRIGPQAKKLKGDGSSAGASGKDNGSKAKGKKAPGSDDDDDEDDDEESVSC